MAPVDAVALFEGAPFRWWIGGGRALELHLQQTWRFHDDLDVGVCRYQAPAVYAWLSKWDLHIAAAGRLSPWDGRHLDADRSENNVWVRSSPGSSWRFDVTIGDGTEAQWIYRRNPRIRRSWNRAVPTTDNGVPYLAPDLQLLFKSTAGRPKDALDAAKVIPALDSDEVAFLDRHLPPAHPWRRLLGGTETGP